jgi:hypothetical protein
MTSGAVYVCGGQEGTGPVREVACTSPLHDWPLPPGYVDASVEAGWRLRNGWGNRRCTCGLYGWEPGRTTEAHLRRTPTTIEGAT